MCVERLSVLRMKKPIDVLIDSLKRQINRRIELDTTSKEELPEIPEGNEDYEGWYVIAEGDNKSFIRIKEGRSISLNSTIYNSAYDLWIFEKEDDGLAKKTLLFVASGKLISYGVFKHSAIFPNRGI